nr:histidine kinase [Mucilaginibacter sp. L294]
MISKSQLLKILIHVAIICLFMGYEIPIVFPLSMPHLIPVVGIAYSLFISFFYVCRYVLLPTIEKHHWSIWWLLLLPLSLLAFLLLSIMVSSLRNYFLLLPALRVSNEIIFFTLWRGIYLLGLAFIFFFQNLAISKEMQARQLEQAYQRALLNPHLLFNTLNFVYYEIRDAQPKQAAALLILSDIMRYALRQSKVTHKASINEEMEQMKRYIQLHQMLSEEGFYIDFVTNMKDHLGQVEIPSLLLVNLVENMFKHGNFKNPGDPALIDLTADDKLIRFRFVNAKRYKAAFRGEHFGIENTRQRLLQTYGNRFKLDIENNDTHYILNLIIYL